MSENELVIRKEIMNKSELYSKYEKVLINESDYIEKSFSMYFELYNSQITHKDSYSVGPIFFNLACNALLEVSITRLAKLYEEDPKVMSIYKYLEFVEQNAQEICIEKKTRLRELVVINKRKLREEYGWKLKQLKQIRDNALAHNNKQIFLYEDKWEVTGLLISDFRTLIKLPYEIINDFMVLLRDTSPSIGAFGGESDIKQIMALLEKGREARQASRKQKIFRNKDI